MMPGREREGCGEARAMGALLSDRGRGGGGSTEGLMDHKSMVSQSCHIKMIQYILA